MHVACRSRFETSYDILEKEKRGAGPYPGNLDVLRYGDYFCRMEACPATALVAASIAAGSPR
jgi:hypothetical protein